MAATTHAISPHGHDGHGQHDHSHDVSKFQIYVQIAMLLAVITGIEIVGVYMPFAKWIVVTALVILSFVKFMFVIFFFMHLRWDKPFCDLFSSGSSREQDDVRTLAMFGAEASIPLPT
jgi:cytochrome c oxidase subunit 4